MCSIAHNTIFVITVKKLLKRNNWKILNVSKAMFIENISYNASEKEVMFTRGTVFIINDILLNEKLKY